MTNSFGINDDSLRLLAENYEWLRMECRRKNFKHQDELFSIVLEKAFGSISSFKDQGHGMKPWLRVIVKNSSTDLNTKYAKEDAKRTSNMVTVDGDSGEQLDIFDNPIDKALHSISAEDRFIYLNDSRNISKALGLLEEPFQETMRLYIAGFSYSEIAAKMGIGTNTVGTRIHRAKRDLRDLLQDFAMEYGFSSKDKKK